MPLETSSSSTMGGSTSFKVTLLGLILLSSFVLLNTGSSRRSSSSTLEAEGDSGVRGSVVTEVKLVAGGRGTVTHRESSQGDITTDTTTTTTTTTTTGWLTDQPTAASMAGNLEDVKSGPSAGAENWAPPSPQGSEGDGGEGEQEDVARQAAATEPPQAMLPIVIVEGKNITFPQAPLAPYEQEWKRMRHGNIDAGGDSPWYIKTQGKDTQSKNNDTTTTSKNLSPYDQAELECSKRSKIYKAATNANPITFSDFERTSMRAALQGHNVLFLGHSHAMELGLATCLLLGFNNMDRPCDRGKRLRWEYGNGMQVMEADEIKSQYLRGMMLGRDPPTVNETEIATLQQLMKDIDPSQSISIRSSMDPYLTMKGAGRKWKKAKGYNYPPRPVIGSKKSEKKVEKKAKQSSEIYNVDHHSGRHLDTRRFATSGRPNDLLQDQYSTIVIAGGVWDLTYRDTDPWTIFQRTLDRIRLAVTKLTTSTPHGRGDGTQPVQRRVILYLLHYIRYPLEQMGMRRKCFSPSRTKMNRDIVEFAAFVAAEELRATHATATSANTPPGDVPPIQILVLDLYKATKRLKRVDSMKWDGHHFNFGVLAEMTKGLFLNPTFLSDTLKNKKLGDRLLPVLFGGENPLRAPRVPALYQRAYSANFKSSGRSSSGGSNSMSTSFLLGGMEMSFFHNIYGTKGDTNPDSLVPNVNDETEKNVEIPKRSNYFDHADLFYDPPRLGPGKEESTANPLFHFLTNQVYPASRGWNYPWVATSVASMDPPAAYFRQGTTKQGRNFSVVPLWQPERSTCCSIHLGGHKVPSYHPCGQKDGVKPLSSVQKWEEYMPLLLRFYRRFPYHLHLPPIMTLSSDNLGEEQPGDEKVNKLLPLIPVPNTTNIYITKQVNDHVRCSRNNNMNDASLCLRNVGLGMSPATMDQTAWIRKPVIDVEHITTEWVDSKFTKLPICVCTSPTQMIPELFSLLLAAKVQSQQRGAAPTRKVITSFREQVEQHCKADNIKRCK